MQTLETSGKPSTRSDDGVVELGRIEQAAVHRRDDFAAGQRVDRGAHAGEHVDRDADGAELQALEVVGLGDRLLEPAERLGRHRAVGERHHVGADRGVELVEQLLAAAVFVPGQQHVGVHAEGRARAPQRQRVLLAVVIDEHAVAAVERALGDRVEQAEGRHHGAGRQHLDLEVAAGHVVDLLGEVERVFVEDVLRRPGALPAHAGRSGLARRAGALRRTRGADGRGSAFEEAAARRGGGRGRFFRVHECLLVMGSAGHSRVTIFGRCGPQSKSARWPLRSIGRRAKSALPSGAQCGRHGNVARPRWFDK